MLFEFKGDDLLSYEITKLSCIEEPKASRKREVGGAGEVVFAQDDGVLRIFPGTSKDTRWLHEDGTISNILLRRTRSRPNQCRQPLVDTPILDYQDFWESFAEQYAFLGLHNVDWLAVDRRFRAQVTSETKPEDLFRIFRDMIDPLHDAHTFIQADSVGKASRGHRPDVERIEKEAAARIWEIIEAKYLDAGVRVFCNGQLQFGLLHPSQAAALSESERNGQTDLIGYLRIRSFSRYSQDGDFTKESELLETALDDIFKDSTKLAGLVIDVRINSGAPMRLASPSPRGSRVTNTRHTQSPRGTISMIQIIEPRHNLSWST